MCTYLYYSLFFFKVASGEYFIFLQLKWVLAPWRKLVAVEGFQSAEVEAIMKTAGDDMIWNAIEDTKDMDMCDEDFFVTGGGKVNNHHLPVRPVFPFFH